MDGLWAGGSDLATDFLEVLRQVQLLGFNAVRLPFRWVAGSNSAHSAAHVGADRPQLHDSPPPPSLRLLRVGCAISKGCSGSANTSGQRRSPYMQGAIVLLAHACHPHTPPSGSQTCVRRRPTAAATAGRPLSGSLSGT